MASEFIGLGPTEAWAYYVRIFPQMWHVINSERNTNNSHRIFSSRRPVPGDSNGPGVGPEEGLVLPK